MAQFDDCYRIDHASVESRSSRGLGHRPFKAATRVRIPSGIPSRVLHRHRCRTLVMSGQVGLSANPPFHASDPNHVIGTLRRKDARHTRQRPAQPWRPSGDPSLLISLGTAADTLGGRPQLLVRLQRTRCPCKIAPPGHANPLVTAVLTWHSEVDFPSGLHPCYIFRAA